jgi:hypothetical protein
VGARFTRLPTRFSPERRRIDLPDRAAGNETLLGRKGVGDFRRRRMSEDEHIELKAQLERLRQEHRDLDAAIEALQAVPGADLIQVQRLKKRRLGLRDRITFIEDQLTPDIIA